MRRRGYTILEVFMAGVLIAFVFFALATLFPTSIGSLRKGMTTTVAADLARQQMEYWKSQPFATLKSATPAPATTMLDGVNYTQTITISAMPDPDMLKIQVGVTWDGDNYGHPGISYSTGVFNVVNPF